MDDVEPVANEDEAGIEEEQRGGEQVLNDVAGDSLDQPLSGHRE